MFVFVVSRLSMRTDVAVRGGLCCERRIGSSERRRRERRETETDSQREARLAGNRKNEATSESWGSEEFDLSVRV